MHMQTSAQIYLPHLQIQATGISILFHYIKDRSYTCLTEQLGNFQFISGNSVLYYSIPWKSPTCCCIADTTSQAFLLLSPVLGRVGCCHILAKGLCKNYVKLKKPPCFFFQEAAKTISRSVFKTQQWNRLELPVHISHSQKHTHMQLYLPGLHCKVRALVQLIHVVNMIYSSV